MRRNETKTKGRTFSEQVGLNTESFERKYIFQKSLSFEFGERGMANVRPKGTGSGLVLDKTRKYSNKMELLDYLC